MIRSNAGSLADLQRAFQDYVLHSGDGFTGSVRDTSKADRTTLLDVYRDGYALRLIEVLTSDYPGVLAMAGPADFDHMARAYIAAHPSRHPNARWVGKHLADFLASTPPYDKSPAAAEMCRPAASVAIPLSRCRLMSRMSSLAGFTSSRAERS